MNHLTFCRDNYKTEEDWKNAVKTFLFLLLEAKQIAVVRYDEPGLGIIIVEYSHNDRSMGTPYPYWLTPEEEETVIYKN